MSNNLDLTQLVDTSVDKETLINDKGGELDAALTETLDVDFTSTSQTLSNTNFRRHFQFNATNLSVARDLTVPAIKRFFFVNNAAGTATLSVVRGSTSIGIEAGANGLFYTDGTTNGLVQAAGGGATRYDVGAFVGGVPTVSVSVLSYPFPRSVTFPSGLTNSQGYAGTAPSAQTDFDIRRNGVSVGTMGFANGSQTAVFTMASDTQYTAGQRLEVVAPANLNGLSDLMMALAGSED